MTETSTKERVGFSLSRVWIIAVNTLTEAVRQKVFNFFLIFGLIFIASASFFAQFTFGEQLKFIKDTCLGVISVISTLIAIVGTAQLLPNEVENRTIYTILAKPVRRIEFLLGKFLGSLSLLGISVAAMCLLFGAVLFIKEQSMLRELRQGFTQNLPPSDVADLNQQMRQIPKQVLDVDLVKAVLAELVKAALVAAITLLVSTFSTSLVFNVVVPFLLITWGETHIDSSLAAILNATTPLFVIVIAHFGLHDEKITVPRLAGLLVGFVGVIVLVSRDFRPEALQSDLLGQLAVLLAALSYAVALIFSRRQLRNAKPVVQSTMILVFATAIMWVVTPVVERPLVLPTQPLAWLAVLWLGVLGLCVAYLLFFWLNNVWGPTRASLVTYIFPVVGVFLGIIFLNEVPDWNMVIGSALVVAGIVVVNLKLRASPAVSIAPAAK